MKNKENFSLLVYWFLFKRGQIAIGTVDCRPMCVNSCSSAKLTRILFKVKIALKLTLFKLGNIFSLSLHLNLRILDRAKSEFYSVMKNSFNYIENRLVRNVNICRVEVI